MGVKDALTLTQNNNGLILWSLIVDIVSYVKVTKLTNLIDNYQLSVHQIEYPLKGSSHVSFLLWCYYCDDKLHYCFTKM